ncbi:MAG: chorismate mutase [Kiloniellales bacterium]|nr:chorismate mutase [Kiloniellales bacterium]
MTADTPSLDDLRREIDEIDIAVHDLLMRRVALADQIGHVKGEGGPFIRPGREARILRRLVARHSGPLPKTVLVSIWREIISAMTALEGPYAVAVYAENADHDGLPALARLQYGAERPISIHQTVLGVLRAVSDGHATVGVLPLPQGEEADPWWRNLVRNGPDVPKIIARLPFAAVDHRFEGLEALAVALAPPEASDRDRSYLVVENSAQLSRGGLREALTRADFHVVDMQNWSARGKVPWVLVEVDDFLDAADPRVRRLAEEDDSPIGQVWVIGSYAVPLSAEELAPDAAPEQSA